MRQFEFTDGYKIQIGKAVTNPENTFITVSEVGTPLIYAFEHWGIDPYSASKTDHPMTNGDVMQIDVLGNKYANFFIRIFRKGEEITGIGALTLNQGYYNWAKYAYLSFFKNYRGTDSLSQLQCVNGNYSGKLNDLKPVLPYKGGFKKRFVDSDGVHPTASVDENSSFYKYVDANIPDEDPGGNSKPGGGEGTFDGTGDDIGVPKLPTLSAVESGFLTLYSPSESQMYSLANYMWSSQFDLNTFKKLFADPMDVIIGVSIVPFAVPTDGARNVKIGFVDTGVSMNHASTQYVELDCGAVNVKEFWGSALDYSPFTKFSIYLPYVGTRTINTDDIMGKTVRVVYHADLLSGTLTAYIKCGNSVLYEYSGTCATQVPITSQNWGSALTAGVTLATAGITAVATGGASLAATGAVAGASYAAGHIAGMKPDVQRSGAVSGAAGMLGVQTPYLIAELPRQSLAKQYGKFNGYPSNITSKLSDLKGYTEIENIHLEIAGATEAELTELETILKGGVIL